MLAKVKSCAIVGLEGAIVEVETDISPGLPSFTIVGLPEGVAIVITKISLVSGSSLMFQYLKL